MTVLLDEHGTRLREIDGIGPVLAARLLGRTGPAGRFASAAAYANYTGTAPVQIASADASRHRLSRYGDRQLNSAIYTIAMIQIRMPASAGAAPTTTRKSPKANHLGMPPARSYDTSQDTSGGSCSPTKTALHERLRKARQLPLDK